MLQRSEKWAMATGGQTVTPDADADLLPFCSLNEMHLVYSFIFFTFGCDMKVTPARNIQMS